MATATITSGNAGAGAPPPTGTVTFTIDGVTRAFAPVVAGSPSTASLTLTSHRLRVPIRSLRPTAETPTTRPQLPWPPLLLFPGILHSCSDFEPHHRSTRAGAGTDRDCNASSRPGSGSGAESDWSRGFLQRGHDSGDRYSDSVQRRRFFLRNPDHADCSGGADSIYAFYQGDSVYGSANSNSLTLDVQTIAITPAPQNPPTNLNIQQGAQGSVAFNIAALGGYTGPVQIVCSAPAQDDMTCTPSPQDL